jgi:hypothetical protein
MLLRVTTATVTAFTQTGYLHPAAYELTVAAALALGLALIALLAVAERVVPRAR